MEELHPYREDFVVVGGVSVALYHALEGRELSEPLYTSDLDLATSDEPIEQRQDSVEDILKDAGMEERIVGRKRGITKFIDPEETTDAFEIEVLMPRTGSGKENVGEPQPGLKAERLRYLNLLIESATIQQVCIEGNELICQLPDPGVFLVHKALTVEKRGILDERRKDYAYILDVLDLYSGEIGELADQVIQAVVTHEYREWIRRGLRELENYFQQDSDPLLYAVELLPDMSERRGHALVEKFIDEVPEINK